MRHITIVLGFVLLTVSSASAQSTPPTQRSPTLIASWMGLVGAGGGLLIYARECGVVGTLGATVRVNAGGYRSTISGTDLVPFNDNGTCGIDFTASIRAVSNYSGRSESETRQYATLDSTERVAADLVRGTADGQKRWRKEILIPAFGLIGAGIMGAILWSDMPVVRDLTISASPDRVQVGRTFGW